MVKSSKGSVFRCVPAGFPFEVTMASPGLFLIATILLSFSRCDKVFLNREIGGVFAMARFRANCATETRLIEEPALVSSLDTWLLPVRLRSP